MADKSSKAKVALGQWLAMSPAERAQAGLPDTQKGFAELWGVTPRTIIRWIKQDETVAEVRDRALERAEQAKRLHPEPEPDPEPPAEPVGGGPAVAEDPAVREFEQLRRKLVSQAQAGDKGAQETYWKFFGKDILERQRAAQESGFSDLSDEELVGEILGLIGREAVEAWLEGQRG